MARNPLRVVIDTNVLVSGIVFKGNPRQVLQTVISRRIQAVSSRPLLAELAEVLGKKLKFSSPKIKQITDRFAELLEIVQPRKSIQVCRDPDDNRVLEAAFAGDCDYLITGDKDLLVLKKYRSIRILTPSEFIGLLGIN